MKISIKENNKNIWDESIFIIENIKRIKDDPTMMVKRIIKDRAPMRLIIYLYTIFVSILTIFSILDNSSHIVEILFALYFVICTICLFIKTIIYKKLIKKAADVFMNYVIEINDEGYAQVKTETIPENLKEDVQDAKEGCPTGAIVETSNEE